MTITSSSFLLHEKPTPSIITGLNSVTFYPICTFQFEEPPPINNIQTLELMLSFAIYERGTEHRVISLTVHGNISIDLEDDGNKVGILETLHFESMNLLRFGLFIFHQFDKWNSNIPKIKEEMRVVILEALRKKYSAIQDYNFDSIH